MTYSDTLLRVRMEHAMDLLVNTNLSIATISYEIGYETPEHFNRKFKKYSGMTPTAYRKGYSAVK